MIEQEQEETAWLRDGEFDRVGGSDDRVARGGRAGIQ